MTYVTRKIMGWLIFTTILLGGLEAALRAYPDLIPLTLLKRFHKEPRVHIAQQRLLWNESQMWVLPRDDGGPTLKLFKPHSQIVYDFHGKDEKGATLMDEQGFCNPTRDSYDRQKIDVIAIGDSFTWCVVLNPEATWVSQIGEMTGKSVYNLGRGGIGPYDYLQILKHFGLPKSPQYVVMNLYEGNDLRDAIRYKEHIAAAREGRVLYGDASDRNTHEIDINAVLDFPVVRNSYALNFVFAFIDKGYEGIKNPTLRLIGGDAPEKVNFRYRLRFPGETVEFNLQNADESEVRIAQRLQRGAVDFSAFEEALSAFVVLSQEHGFVPIVTYSPSAYTAYAHYVEFDDPTLSELMPWFSRTQRQFLKDKATELGFLFVDLTPAMQTAARKLQEKTLIYYPTNVHFTEKGNQIVAQSLAAMLSKPNVTKFVKANVGFGHVNDKTIYENE